MQKTVAATDTLKGIAILAVLVNHYLNMNISGDSRGFANLWIAVFFILSGYGIQRSLQARHGDRGIDAPAWLRFYYFRFVRVMPLYWVAYLSQSLLFGQELSLRALLGLHAPGHFWFIPAILHCYLIAPFVHLMISWKRGTALATIVIVLATSEALLTFGAVSPDTVQTLNFYHWRWQDVSFLHLFLFSAAMFLPDYFAGRGNGAVTATPFFFWTALLCIFLFIGLARSVAGGPRILDFLILTVAPLGAIWLFCVYALTRNISIAPLARLGSISYAVYLFHIILFRSIDRLVAPGQDSPLELLVMALSMPFFLFCCARIELFGAGLSTRLRALADTGYVR